MRERIEKLDQVEHAKPNAEFIYASFEIFAERHPWTSQESVRPKSVAREMVETGNYLVPQLNGELYTENLRDARATDTFTLRGGDEAESFVSCMFFVPRDRHNTQLRQLVGRILAGAYNGEVIASDSLVADTALARMAGTATGVVGSTFLALGFLVAAGRTTEFYEQEARLAGSLSHPNVLGIFDVGTHEGSPFIVTEFLEGQTLRDALIKKALPLLASLAMGAMSTVTTGLGMNCEAMLVMRKNPASRACPPQGPTMATMRSAALGPLATR